MPHLPRLPPSPAAPFPLLLATLSQHVPNLARSFLSTTSSHLAKRDKPPSQGQIITGGVLIPTLVLLSGLFAGLTLGYMSLDETQLHVLSISGTPKQRKYAAAIEPIRKNGHLLLVTLLLANMITNETLPIIADPVLGGGAQSVVVSTVLIVIFAEIIPQSICTRHGLYIGAKMAPLMRVLLWTLGLIAWPVAKLLEYTLGPHHGIIYRRAELKELIALHSTVGDLGGDLRTDTVTIIGATLDLQEKTARQAMTPIERVFMLSIDARLDYDTLRRICLTGHSRIPVYEEVEVPGTPEKCKRILGILLVKQCVLLDPEDAIPVRKIPLNKLVSVAQNEPLLGILDRFQEGRSHMAIVSRLTIETAASVKKAVKRGLTQRIKDRVGISDSSSSTSSSSSSDEEGDEEEGKHARKRSFKFRPGRGAQLRKSSTRSSDVATTADETLAATTTINADTKNDDDGADDGASTHGVGFRFGRKRRASKKHRKPSSSSADADVELGEIEPAAKKPSLVQTVFAPGNKEQSMPADAVLGKEGAQEFLMGFDPAVAPLGIITLEDVLEELIGEEIYDEFDAEGAGHGEPSGYVPPKSPVEAPSRTLQTRRSAPDLKEPTPSPAPPAPIPVASRLPSLSKGLSFLASRSRSAPGHPRESPVTPQTTQRLTHAAVDEEDDDKTALSDSEMYTDEKGKEKGVHDVQDDHDQLKEKGKEEEKKRDKTPALVISTATNDISQPSPATLVPPSPTILAPPAQVALRGAPISRSGSPAPLEALLLDRSRSRRAQAQGSGALTPRATTPVRGARFKSSPLGVVVAEQVKASPGAEEERIPKPMDKAGPDKVDEGQED